MIKAQILLCFHWLKMHVNYANKLIKINYNVGIVLELFCYIIQSLFAYCLYNGCGIIHLEMSRSHAETETLLRV